MNPKKRILLFGTQLGDAILLNFVQKRGIQRLGYLF